MKLGKRKLKKMRVYTSLAITGSYPEWSLVSEQIMCVLSPILQQLPYMEMHCITHSVVV